MATTIVLNPIGSTEVWNVSTETWNVTTAVFFGELPAPNLSALGSNAATISIGVSGVPEISVNRDSNGATISLISTSKYNLRLYRANDHREVFYRYVDNIDGGSNYSDNGIWNTYAFEWDSNNVDYDEYSESKNYKYKASFMATATINGSPVEVESQTSEPVYTVGNKTL